ncbi:hypothetical protein Syun_000055 [Stephania yunnanensis]|uniref:Uncharacterized protein n=1 Tax=Stephania yunnanensis TaxID=152371 RepID=A0AAP0LCA9_9MAGN
MISISSASYSLEGSSKCDRQLQQLLKHLRQPSTPRTSLPPRPLLPLRLR